MIQSIGWHNYHWKDIEAITVSARDRGLKFGDGIFETILIRRREPILLENHITRLSSSANILDIKFNLKKEFIENIIKTGISKLSIKNNQYGSIRINYSRGLSNSRSIKVLNNEFDIKNFWLEFYLIEKNNSPLKVLISEKEKRNENSTLCQCKSFSYNQSIIGIIEAQKKGFDDCLMLNTKNELCSGSTFNLFLKRNNRWITPRAESGCLKGIMRQKAINMKMVEEEQINPQFKKNDILIAINSLFCKQIKQVNNINFESTFDTQYFWDKLFN